MKTTIIYGHPYDKSFNRAILHEVLQCVGEEGCLIDLIKDGFNPVMSEEDLRLYGEGRSNDPLVMKYNRILDNTDRAIFIFPIWWYDMPAVMRGFMDKVHLRGSAYGDTPAGVGPLRNIKTYLFTTSNATNDNLKDKFGDPIPGTLIAATLRGCGYADAEWYNMEDISHSTEAQRKEFLAKIKDILA